MIDGDGVIYLLANQSDATEDQTLFAVTPEGVVKWSLPIPGPLPGVHQGGLAFGSDGTLYVAGFPNDTLTAIGEAH